MQRVAPGSFLEYTRNYCGSDKDKAHRTLGWFTEYFGAIDFNRRPTRRDIFRFNLLAEFYEISRDLRLRGQLINVLRTGQYYTNRGRLSTERRLAYTIQNYRYGRVLERKLHMGMLNDKYALTFEPSEGYTNQEGLWNFALADMTAKGNPVIARISINIHRERGKRIASLAEIHGEKGKKAELDEFLKTFKTPWSIFLIRLLSYHAKKSGIHIIRGTGDSTQPFFHQTNFISGKIMESVRRGEPAPSSYSLYSQSLEKLGFKRSPNGTFYEEDLTGMQFKSKRERVFDSIFTPLSSPIPPRLPGPPHRKRLPRKERRKHRNGK